MAWKYMLLMGGSGLFALALGLVIYDLQAAYRYRRALMAGVAIKAEPQPAPWRMTVALLAMSWAPLLIAMSIVRRG